MEENSISFAQCVEATLGWEANKFILHSAKELNSRWRKTFVRSLENEAQANANIFFSFGI